MEACPEQLVEALIRALVAGVARRAGQDEIDLEAGSGSRRRGEPAVVRPPPSRGDQRVGAVGERRPDEELQVPELVAAERERQQVLALDPDVGAATERSREPGGAIEGRRAVEQDETRQRGDQGRNDHRPDPSRC